MKSRVEDALNRHKNGYNCCQSVVCTYADLLGMDEKTAFRASEAFGLGIAKRYEMCGSVCGMMMLAGLENSDGNLKDPKTKLSTFTLGHDMCRVFEEWNSSCECNVLRGSDGVSDRIRSCRGCVADCARIVEYMLFPDTFEPYKPRDSKE